MYNEANGCFALGTEKLSIPNLTDLQHERIENERKVRTSSRVLIGLLLLLAVSSFGVSKFLSDSLLQGIFLNLAAGFFGATITFWLIDRRYAKLHENQSLLDGELENHIRLRIVTEHILQGHRFIQQTQNRIDRLLRYALSKQDFPTIVDILSLTDKLLAQWSYVVRQSEADIAESVEIHTNLYKFEVKIGELETAQESLETIRGLQVTLEGYRHNLERLRNQERLLNAVRPLLENLTEFTNATAISDPAILKQMGLEIVAGLDNPNNQKIKEVLAKYENYDFSDTEAILKDISKYLKTDILARLV